MFVYSLLPCTAAAATLCVQFRSYRSPYDTKARRARELRPRRNYMLPEEVELHRKSRLQEKPETADTYAQEEFVDVPRDFRYDSMKYLKLHMHVAWYDNFFSHLPCRASRCIFYLPKWQN